MYLNDNIKVLVEAKAPVASWLAHLGTDPTQVYERVFRNGAGLLDWRMDDGNGLFEKLPPPILYGDWRPKDKAEGGATVIVGAGLIHHHRPAVVEQNLLLPARTQPQWVGTSQGHAATQKSRQ